MGPGRTARVSSPGSQENEGAGIGFEDIHLTLRKRILNEDYFPGQKLSENALAREFGCSRTPVREALKRLENERLIEVRPQSGAYVRAVSGKDYVDLLEVRAYLEGLAFRLALERATEGDILALEGLVAEMDAVVGAQPVDMQRYAELHYDFHAGIVRLAGNELLSRMFEGLNLRTSHMFLRSMNAESAARTQEEHHRIARQLGERDPKGEKFVIDHLWRKKANFPV
jgi:DNA-binding GntR family transcriptional regulator